MKKLFFLSLAIFFSQQTIFAQGIEFEHNKKFAEILDAAGEENKLIFMDCYTTWCGPCKRLAATVFVQEEVGNFHNKNFINTKFDMENGEGPEIAQKYGIRAYPTLLWINSKGEVVNKVVGGLDGSGLIEAGRKAMGSMGTTQESEKLKMEYEKGNRNIDFLSDYLLSLNSMGANYNKPFADYLKAIPMDINKDSKHLKNIFELTNDLQSPGIPYLIKNKETFIAAVQEKFFNKKINDITKAAINKAVKDKNDTLFNDAMNFAKNIGSKNNSASLREMAMEYYDRTGNFAKYDKEATAYLKKEGATKATQLNKAAWQYYINTDNKGQLSKAKKWATKAVALNNNCENNTTYAYLCYKLGDSKEAIKACDFALLKGNEAGADIKSAKALKEMLVKEETKLKQQVQEKK